MTGPENYREAERFAESAATHAADAVAAAATDDSAEAAKFWGWAAHAREMGVLHATLALAAATAICASDASIPPKDWEAWDAVAGVKPGGEVL